MAKTKATLKRPVRRLTQSELDNFLDKAADILRGNVDHSEFRGYVFALLFFKRISDIYHEEIRKLTERLGDEHLARDPKLHNFVVPDACLWAEVARKSRNELGPALNEAMIAIERANQPKFDGILTNKIDFNRSMSYHARSLSILSTTLPARFSTMLMFRMTSSGMPTSTSSATLRARRESQAGSSTHLRRWLT
jgi:type I restriction-modification system DNA methylase subunit